MFRISERSTPSCMVVQVEGRVTGDEYDDFADAFEKAVEGSGETNLVIELLGDIKYGDMDAVEEDLEFAFKDYRKARRAAFVGDQRMIRAMIKLFSPFTRTSERFFDVGELDAAIEWACAEQ